MSRFWQWRALPFVLLLVEVGVFRRGTPPPSPPVPLPAPPSAPVCSLGGANATSNVRFFSSHLSLDIRLSSRSSG